MINTPFNQIIKVFVKLFSKEENLKKCNIMKTLECNLGKYRFFSLIFWRVSKVLYCEYI